MAATGIGVTDRLSTLVSGPVLIAGESDRVGGVAARWVVTPTDTAEVSAVLAATSALGLTVVARGAGTTLSWGAPPERVDVIVDMTAVTGIVEHTAGDLVVVVRAGTRLADLQAALRPYGQRLALDGDHGTATIGGLLALGLSGPSRLLHGTLRDLLIGATMVRADGVVAHTGGKVVKNVAGFDLGKLLHGSWGTLGIVTEAVFRLHPVPPAERWVTAPFADPDRGAELTQRVLQAQLVPAAIEIDRPTAGPGELVVLLEGPAATVGDRACAAADLLGPDAGIAGSPPSWWGRRPAGPGDVLVRVTTEITGLARLLTALDAAASAGGLALHTRGSVGVGSLLAGLPSSVDGPALAALISRLRRDMGNWGGSVVVVDGPLDRLAGIDRWGPVAGLDLMHRLKERFDPGRLLAPGRFVGGI
jgi:glycolate oxidase FAD binding subunit